MNEKGEEGNGCETSREGCGGAHTRLIDWCQHALVGRLALRIKSLQPSSPRYSTTSTSRQMACWSLQLALWRRATSMLHTTTSDSGCYNLRFCKCCNISRPNTLGLPVSMNGIRSCTPPYPLPSSRSLTASDHGGSISTDDY